MGDPGNCFDENEWKQVLEQTSSFTNPVYTSERGNVVALGTGGDGMFDVNGNPLMPIAVDSGLIGLVPESYFPSNTEERINFEEVMRKLGRFVYFEKPSYVKKMGEILKFGKYVIDTSADEEESNEDVEDMGVEYWEVMEE